LTQEGSKEFPRAPGAEWYDCIFMAKILLVTHDCVGNWFSLRFLKEGHSVDIYYCGKKNKSYINCLGGLCPDLMFEKPDFSKYDLILFDMTDSAKLADEAASLAPTIGDSSFASEIENNRFTGIKIMEECDINVPSYEVFNDLAEAKSYIRKNNKRYVFKAFGDQDTSFTYVSQSAEDMLKYIDKLSSVIKGTEFMLQEVVNGIEVSTEGWFDGQDFHLVNGTLEEKKFMDGGRGPNTGCAGNLVFTYDSLNLPLVFREGLGKLRFFLQSQKYRGMIDLNTIVSDRKMYGLEWTPRLGYDAAATLFHIISSDLAEFMGAIASGVKPEYRLKNSFSASTRISIPPYPSDIPGHHHSDIPIQGLEDVEDIWRSYYLYDCCLDGDELVTAGVCGFITAPIASGDTLQEAFSKVDGRIKKLQIPNMQYRNDIMSCCNKRYNTLREQGWLR
jgi:phosphoribosylamine--glycine ligase